MGRPADCQSIVGAELTLSDIDAPNSYTITGEGQGGVAGFAKGGAKVFLTDDAGATLLKYEVNAQVGGKLAQLGARLVVCGRREQLLQDAAALIQAGVCGEMKDDGVPNVPSPLPFAT